MKSFKSAYWFLIPLLIGCVNLKIVNGYAESSVKAIEGYKSTEFSFKSICLRECEVNALKERIINDFKPLQEPTACDCKERAKADEAIAKILFGLTSYLESLQKLSSEDNVPAFKFDGLADALDKAEWIKVDIKEINAYKSLVNLTSKIVFNAKRQKALQTNIAEANAPFSVLVDRLQSIIDIQLMEALEIQKKSENTEYIALIKFSSTITEKINFEKNYVEKLNNIENKKIKLNKYKDILKSVKDGHNEMYKNGAKLDSKYLVAQLSSYYTSIKKLKTEFDNIKTEKQ